MAAGAFTPYTAFLNQLAQQSFDFLGQTIQAALLDDAYTPDPVNDTVWSDISGQEIGDTDYARQTLANKTISLGGPSATLDNASPTDNGDGTVTMPATGHPFTAGDPVQITGTSNYDGGYYILSVGTDTFTIRASFTSETFGGSETVQAKYVIFDADDVDFGDSVSISARYLVLWVDTGTGSTSYLMGYVDLNDGGSSNVSSTNSDFDIQWSSSGIYQIKP